MRGEHDVSLRCDHDLDLRGNHQFDLVGCAQLMLLILLFGSLVGTTLGVMGGGGSALAVPLLAYGVGLETKEAIATSLVVVGLASLAGALRHWRDGTIDVRVAVVFGIFGSMGSAAGAQAARALTPAVQMTLFAVSLLAAAGVMLRYPAPASAHGETETASRLGIQAILAALGAGLLTGVVGIGGGFVVVPVLVFIVAMPMHRAIGASLLVIAFNALGGVVSYASYMSLSPTVVVPFAAAAIVSAVIATIIAGHIDEVRLRSTFAVGLLVLGIFTIAKESLVLWS